MLFCVTVVVVVRNSNGSECECASVRKFMKVKLFSIHCVHSWYDAICIYFLLYIILFKSLQLQNKKNI